MRLRSSDAALGAKVWSNMTRAQKSEFEKLDFTKPIEDSDRK